MKHKTITVDYPSDGDELHIEKDLNLFITVRLMERDKMLADNSRTELS